MYAVTQVPTILEHVVLIILLLETAQLQDRWLTFLHPSGTSSKSHRMTKEYQPKGRLEID